MSIAYQTSLISTIDFAFQTIDPSPSLQIPFFTEQAHNSTRIHFVTPSKCSISSPKTSGLSAGDINTIKPRPIADHNRKYPPTFQKTAQQTKPQYAFHSCCVPCHHWCRFRCRKAPGNNPLIHIRSILESDTVDLSRLPMDTHARPMVVSETAPVDFAW